MAVLKQTAAKVMAVLFQLRRCTLALLIGGGLQFIQLPLQLLQLRGLLLALTVRVLLLFLLSGFQLRPLRFQLIGPGLRHLQLLRHLLQLCGKLRLFASGPLLLQTRFQLLTQRALRLGTGLCLLQLLL